MIKKRSYLVWGKSMARASEIKSKAQTKTVKMINVPLHKKSSWFEKESIHFLVLIS